MAYDPRTGIDTAAPVTNDGGRSGTIPTTTPRPAPAAPEQPRPSQDQIAAAAAQGMTYRLNKQTGGWDLVPMNPAEQSANLQEQQSAGKANGPGVAAPVVQQPVIPGASAQPVQPATRGAAFGAAPAPAGPAVAGRAPPGAAGFAGTTMPERFGAAPSGPGGFTPTTVDYSRYDQAAQGYDRAVSTFQSELDRLSGVDPFGNEAFLRKATDRAAGQAQGLAAGGLSTATARAGNMRQAQGVQASLAAQGIEQQAVQRNADENQAAQLRLGAAGGLANTLGAKAQNEVELAKLQTQTVQANVQQYLDKYKFDKALNQQDVENLRQAAVAYSQIDMQRYQTDVQYQAEVDKNILGKYVSDQQLQGVMSQIKAQEHISPGEFLMGAIGAAGGVLGGIATAPKGSLVNPNSDRRLKFDVRDPDLRDLEDFLGRTKGKLYRYKDPGRPGNKAGVNYGPMAQDLAKSKIGRTVLGKNEDGTYHVDAARLALADHAALAELAREVKALKSGK